MDFAFTEEQEMLRKIARDFLATECPKDTVRKMIKDEKGHTTELWNKIAELGWPGLIIPEQFGGIGGSFLDAVALVEELGRACLPGPFHSSLMGTLAVMRLGSARQQQELLPKIASGKLILTSAFSEPGTGYELDHLECQASAEGNEYVISGTKLFVENAHVADLMLCAARTKHDGRQEGIDLFLVESGAKGVIRQPIETIAGDKQYQVAFQGVRVPEGNRLGETHTGKDNIRKLVELATVLKCAEMLGGAQQVMDMTVTYVKERVQFDHPIGSLQAIQHHCANMMIDLEGMRYVTYLAAWKAGDNQPFAKEAAVAKAWSGQAYKRICDLAHQCHGAIGFCEDHDLPLYSRRAKTYEFALGDSRFQRRFVAKEIGL
ncbi:MAG: acyl-CoA dehydrogenase [Chloroflexi bacterium]|nr:acyl-CoA dehydrogenase [Chloroflexota bacterium]